MTSPIIKESPAGPPPSKSSTITIGTEPVTSPIETSTIIDNLAAAKAGLQDLSRILRELNVPGIDRSTLENATAQLNEIEAVLVRDKEANSSKYYKISDLAALREKALDTYDNGPTPRANYLKNLLSATLTYGTIGSMILIGLEPLLYASQFVRITPTKFFNEQIPTVALFASFIIPFISGSLIHFVNRSLNSEPVTAAMHLINENSTNPVKQIPKLRIPPHGESFSSTQDDWKSKFILKYYDSLQDKFNRAVYYLDRILMQRLTGNQNYALVSNVSDDNNILATIHLAQQRSGGKSSLPTKFSIVSALCLATSWFPCELLAGRILGHNSLAPSGSTIGLSFLVTATPWIFSFLQNHLIAGSYIKHPLVHASAHYVKIASRIANIGVYSQIASGLDFATKIFGTLMIRYRSWLKEQNSKTKI